MGKVFDIDEHPTLCEPFIFNAKSKQHRCIDVTGEVLNKIDAIAEKRRSEGAETVRRAQLAYIAGAKEDDFAGLTLKAMNGIIQAYLADANDPLDLKGRRLEG